MQKKYTSLLALLAALKNGELPRATKRTPDSWPEGGYGFEFDKGVHFRYWPGHNEPDEEFDPKMDNAEEIFDFAAVCDAAGVDYGDDNCDAFVTLLFHEMEIADCLQ